MGETTTPSLGRRRSSCWPGSEVEQPVSVPADRGEPAEPLRGVVVAVTRSETGPLALALTSAGADVVHVPLIEIGPPL